MMLIALQSTKRNLRIQASLVSTQQRQSVLRQPRPRQHSANAKLHPKGITAVRCQLLRLRQDALVLGLLQVLCQHTGGFEIGFRGALDVGEHGIVLREGDVGAEFEQTGGECIIRGERGGVEVEDRRVAALVEGVVDGDKLCGGEWLAIYYDTVQQSNVEIVRELIGQFLTSFCGIWIHGDSRD